MEKQFITSHQRIYGLDFLRSVAIFAVLLYHLPKESHQLIFRALSHFGYWGVDLFFVLSGFLIGSQLFRQISNDSFQFKSFYLRRFFRILPAYYGLLIFAYIYDGPSVFIDKIDWRYLLFLQNIGELNYLSHTWSLCVEEHFYILFPLFIFTFKNKINFRSIVIATIVIFTFKILLRGILWGYFRPEQLKELDIHKAYESYFTHFFYPSFTRLEGIASGLFLAYLKVHQSQIWNQLVKKNKKNLSLSLIFLALSAFIGFNKLTPIAIIFSFSLIPIGFSFLLLYSVNPKSFINRFKLPLLSKIATISYSLYLIHPYSYDIGERIFKHFNASYFNGFAYLVFFLISIFMATILYFLIERPFLLARKRILKD